MKMKWMLAPVLMMSAAVAVAQSGAYGPGNMGGEGMHKDRMEKMASYMGLDESQKEQMQQLMEAHHQQKDALYSKYGLTPENRAAMHKEMQEMRNAHRESMSGIFTEEQREKMTAMKAGKGHGGGCSENMGSGYHHGSPMSPMGGGHYGEQSGANQ